MKIAKIDQGKEGHVEIDNREKDVVLLWGHPKKLGREGEEAQVIVVDRKNVKKLIGILIETL